MVTDAVNLKKIKERNDRMQEELIWLNIILGDPVRLDNCEAKVRRNEGSLEYVIGNSYATWKGTLPLGGRWKFEELKEGAWYSAEADDIGITLSRT